MKLKLDKNFIWFAVSRNSEERKLHFYLDNIKIAELDIRLDAYDPDFFFPMDVSRFKGKMIDITGVDGTSEGAISCNDLKPETSYSFRPEIHFTAEYGWINDPNGLIYADGVYHLYYQWNPYGTDWGNMHWGHAVSSDLIRWEHRPTAMEPDEYGTIYSGSAFRDSKNASGFGKDALLFYYTASGGRNEWSLERGNLHTQRIAVSNDGGETLLKKETIIPNIIGENRDPKVFWHEKSGAYIMVLYLEETEFMILRSEDMLHWTESQRFCADKMWECPNLMELPVRRKSGGDDRYESKWVFWSADGYYMIGEFDGYRFTPETEVLEAYDTKLPYAAQTYSGIEDRTVHIAWYRTENDKGGFRGMMSIPTELSLIETEEGLRIAFKPVKELWDRTRKLAAVRSGENISLTGRPFVAEIEYDALDNKCDAVGTQYDAPDTECDVPRHECEGVGTGTKTLTLRIGDSVLNIKNPEKKAVLIIDHGIIECMSEDGLRYTAIESEDDILRKSIRIDSEEINVRMNIFEII